MAGQHPDVEQPRGLLVSTLVMAALLLVGCQGQGEGERPSPSRSITASVSPTRTVSVPSPTRSLGPDESTPPPTEASASPTRRPASEPAGSPSRAGTPTRSGAPAEPEPTGEPAPPAEDPSPEAAGSSDQSSSGLPAWAWWVLALLVAGAVAIPVLLRARRRRAWREERVACEAEVAWLARTLIPELRETGSREALAGGWSVGGSARVAAVEDRLTVLESTARDEADRARALELRDAVRSARTRLDTLARTGTVEEIRRGLDAAVSDLEAVLATPSAERTT